MERLFGVEILSNFQPRYNLAPSQPALVIREEHGTHTTSFLHWGLIPAWAKEPAIAHTLINARAETLAKKPSFRDAFHGLEGGGRCLIPADGFYEWDPATKPRQPHRFTLKDGSLMAFAGLWADNAALKTITFTIITTTGNSLMEKIGHDRMPVLITPDNQETWLSPSSSEQDLAALMRPAPHDLMTSTMVGTVVNSPKNDVPACLDPVDGPDQGDLFR